MKDCLLCNISQNNPTYIAKSEYWTLLLNYMQPTLGSTLLVLNRHIEKMSDLSEQEHLDALSQMKNLEGVLKNTFNPDMINYLMLANVVKHIHYHIIPRYSLPIIYQGKKFEDECFGHTPKISSDIKDANILESIRTVLNCELLQ